MVLKATEDVSQYRELFTVFLAGSIEMGAAENWQESICSRYEDDPEVLILNPRRDDWDSSWKQESSNPQFAGQVRWELQGLELADLILFYFSPETKSPVSLLELGLFAASGKLVVCCPEDFWRKGNVDIVCQQWKIPQVGSSRELLEQIGTMKQQYTK